MKVTLHCSCGMIKTLEHDSVQKSNWRLLKKRYSEKHLKGICPECQIKTEAGIRV